MSDAILTHGREELGIERYDRASSAGIDLVGRMLKRVVEEAGWPLKLTLTGIDCAVAMNKHETERVLSELDHWKMVADAQLTLAVEKGDYYTAVAYKTALINLRTAEICVSRTHLLNWTLQS